VRRPSAEHGRRGGGLQGGGCHSRQEHRAAPGQAGEGGVQGEAAVGQASDARGEAGAVDTGVGCRASAVEVVNGLGGPCGHDGGSGTGHDALGETDQDVARSQVQDGAHRGGRSDSEGLGDQAGPVDRVDEHGGEGAVVQAGDTGWVDIAQGQVGAGQYQYRVVGATMFFRKKGDEWRPLPKPATTMTHVATLPQTYGKLERASTLVVKKGDPKQGKGDEWTSDGSMIEVWPNWTVKYTCLDLQGTYAMDLLKTTVEKPLLTPAQPGGGVTEEKLNELKTSLEAKITAATSEIASTKARMTGVRDKVTTLEATVREHTSKIVALENKPGGGAATGATVLVLGPTENLPAGTKPGTVIVRRSN